MTGPKLHYASQFIIAAMDEWGRPVTPTTGTPVYLKQDYAALQARVKQVVEEGRAISRLNVQQAVEIGGLQARVRELDEVVKHYATCDEHRRKEWQADLDRLHQVEAENAALRAELDRLHKVEQERDQVRARVGELEEAVQGFLTRMNEWGEWDDGCFYYAKKAAPELQEPIRQARRALKGKEEHGTTR